MSFSFDSHKLDSRPVGGARLIFGYLGAFIAMIGGITMLPLLLLVVFPGEWRALPSFMLPGFASLVIGGLMYFFLLFRKEKDQLGKHHDALLIVLLWAMTLLIGSLPIVLHGVFVPGAYRYTFFEALFESSSGYTATGLTAYRSFLDSIVANATNAEGIVDKAAVDTALGLECPHIFLAYRSTMHFFGGIGLVLIAVSAISDAHGLKLYSAEGHNDKLLENLKKSARLILLIYFGYIILGTVAFWFFGMDWFDAFNHSIAALATGGLSTRSSSMFYFLDPNLNLEVYNGLSSGCSLFGATPSFSSLSGWNTLLPFNTIGIEITAIVLMILGATNFILHTHLFTFRWREFFRDIEVRFALILGAVAVPIMVLGTYLYWNNNIGMTDALGEPLITAPISWAMAFRYGLFQFVSCMTTTGFSNVKDIIMMGPSVLLISIIVMSIGGGAGSTAGGLKQFRVAHLFKELHWKFKHHMESYHFVHPRNVWSHGEKKVLKDQDLSETSLFFFLYIVMILVGASVTAVLPNITFDKAIYTVSTCLSGTGNSMINFYDYAALNPPVYYNLLMVICVIYMFLGRLEILPVIHIFRISFKNAQNAIKK